MPELPEVETVVRDLRPLIVGQTIHSIRTGTRKLRTPWNPEWNTALVGRQIRSLNRRGKWIIAELDTSAMLLHLGMTGQLTVHPHAETVADHVHLQFQFADTELRFRDVRRFGGAEWFASLPVLHELLNTKLGPEPFDTEAKSFASVVRSANRTLKAILLDQAVIAGVGNIYADEALFRSHLHPETRGVDISMKQAEALRQAIVAVITKAIDARGSTIRDYIGGSGLRGGFQTEFCVYGRTGEPCTDCGTPIERVVVAGRSSHFCPKCQKRKR
jgi:formamidopyrimidine-DNA glycosylase